MTRIRIRMEPHLAGYRDPNPHWGISWLRIRLRNIRNFILHYTQFSHEKSLQLQFTKLFHHFCLLHGSIIFTVTKSGNCFRSHLSLFSIFSGNFTCGHVRYPVTYPVSVSRQKLTVLFINDSANLLKDNNGNFVFVLLQIWPFLSRFCTQFSTYYKL